MLGLSKKNGQKSGFGILEKEDILFSVLRLSLYCLTRTKVIVSQDDYILDIYVYSDVIQISLSGFRVDAGYY